MGFFDRPGDPAGGEPPAFTDSDQLLNAVVGFDGFRFEPDNLVRAVNFFHGRGKQQSLATLRSSGNNPAKHEQVFLIARLLYEPAESDRTLPHLDLGQPDLPGADDNRQFPVFPLHLVEDLPLLLVGGYLVGGESLPPSVYLDWCANYGRLRNKPLSPGDNPLASLDKFLFSATWQKVDPGDFHTGMLRHQILRCLPKQFQPTEEEGQALLRAVEPTPFWLAKRMEEQHQNLVWDRDQASFQVGS